MLRNESTVQVCDPPKGGQAQRRRNVQGSDTRGDDMKNKSPAPEKTSGQVQKKFPTHL